MVNGFRRPNVKNIEAAIRAYYGNGYIGNKEMREIFGNLSSATICKLKDAARQLEREKGQPEVVASHISVKIAFDAWGIDADELVRNWKKLKQLQIG